MNADEIVKALRESLPPKIDYAELVGAEGFAHGACYVWDDPLPYLMSNAADLLESQQARITELEAQLAESQRRERSAVGLINKVAQAVEVAFNATDYVKPNTGIWHTLGLALDWIKAWRGPQEAGEGETE